MTHLRCNNSLQRVYNLWLYITRIRERQNQLAKERTTDVCMTNKNSLQIHDKLELLHDSIDTEAYFVPSISSCFS